MSQRVVSSVVQFSICTVQSSSKSCSVPEELCKEIRRSGRNIEGHEWNGNGDRSVDKIRAASSFEFDIFNFD